MRSLRLVWLYFGSVPLCGALLFFIIAAMLFDCPFCGYDIKGLAERRIFSCFRNCGEVNEKEVQKMKMPKGGIETAMFAPCGMNCQVCYKHCRRQKPCAGCLKSDLGKPERCRKCKIKNCVKSKGLLYCFMCSAYPCKQIRSLEKSYNERYQASLMDNSRCVQQYGLEKFMEWQKKSYTCSKCGGIVSVHDRECSECREKTGAQSEG